MRRQGNRSVPLANSNFTRPLRVPVCLLAMRVLLCPALAGQQRSSSSPSQAQSTQSESRIQDLSGLAKENVDRVAAPATVIEAILRKEPGLMLALKRLVADQATENGQIVRDSDLTDDAIFNRLTTDVEFRATVTRLLQRYGYLMPQPNPGSVVAQEQEVLLHEHLRLLQAQYRAQQGVQNEEEQAAAPSTNANSKQQRRGTVPVGTGMAPAAPDWLNTPSPGIAQPPNGNLPFPSRSPAILMPAGLSEGAGLAPTISDPSLSLAGSEARTQEERVSMASDLRERATVSSSLLPEEASDSSQAQTNVAPSSNPENGMGYVRPRMVREPNPYAGIPSLYDMYEQVSSARAELSRFGADIFENGAAQNNLLPMDLPVGPNYVLGPGDGLAIDLWGSISQRLYRVVDREGRVALPEVGPILVNGQNLGDVQQEVQKALRTQFRDVSADVSLARLRTVRVYVVGDVEHPGAYDVSSLSTPLNALIQAGGPTQDGSLRILEHFRGKQLVQDVDVYDLLLHGVQTDIKRLQDGDTVLVPPIGSQVTVEGMVRRPAIYELKSEKTLADVFALAGGILPTATLRHIEVQRVIAHQQRTMLSLNVSDTQDSAQVQKQLESFSIQDGDVVNVFPIAPYNQGAIYLEGHVLRPGRYSYHPGMKLTDLISSYKDLQPEPAEHYAEIIRLNAPNYRPSVVSFDLANALAHPADAPKLEPMDTVRIFSQFDFTNPPEVSVGGAVRAPGTYLTPGQVHLSDAIHLAGGMTPDALRTDAQVFRYLPDSKLKVMDVNLAEALDGNPAANIILDPRDRVVVHENPARVDPASVYIQGEVAKPGRFPLTTKMRVADLIRLAGGFKRSADTESADMTRFLVQGQKQLVGEHQEIQLAAALSGDPDQDLSLLDGDVLTIKQVPGWNDIGASVTVRGEVRHPGVYGIRPGERLTSVLERAGGFLPTAYPAGAVLESDSVRVLQQKSREKLIEEIRQDAASAKTDINATAAERTQLQQASLQQHQQEIQALEEAPVTGRMVIRLQSNLAHFRNTPDDVELRNGDSISIPKRPDFVLVIGQVYNSNAVTYLPGRNAGWYLNQAGGPTSLANKKAIFVVRASGGVVTGRGQGLWSGNVLSTRIEPGDTIVVPEKPVGGSTTWKNLLSVAQIAQAGAMSAFVFTH